MEKIPFWRFNMNFLPICKQDMLNRGWSQCDFVYVIGDAYVDHPSFGHAIISRILESHGYSVGIISQPNWKDPKSIDIYGRPRLGFLVSGGNMDSMVNHYSVTKHRRKTDAFTPGGVMGKRPDYATVVYCNLIRQTYKDVPILIGDKAADGSQLRPYIVWFGEFVSEFEKAVEVVRNADIFLVIGTSLTVQPAASLVRNAHPEIPRFIINPREAYDPYDDHFPEGYEHIKENATTGVETFIDRLIELTKMSHQ